MAATGAVFSYLSRTHQKGLVETLSHDTVRKVLDSMTPDDQVRLLGALPAKVTREIIASLPPHELREARDLLG